MKDVSAEPPVREEKKVPLWQCTPSALLGDLGSSVDNFLSQCLCNEWGRWEEDGCVGKSRVRMVPRLLPFWNEIR
jgi:hypothetical protein